MSKSTLDPSESDVLLSSNKMGLYYIPMFFDFCEENPILADIASEEDMNLILQVDEIVKQPEKNLENPSKED